MAEIDQLKGEVVAFGKELKDTEERLSAIKSKYSRFSSEGRQSIVRECLAEVKPALEKNLPKFANLAENIRKLGNIEGIDGIKEEFREILSSIRSALEKMANYGAEADKSVAVALSAKVDPILARLG